MQQFTVTTIYTTIDGHVILSGPKGSINVRRLPSHSTAQYQASPFVSEPCDAVHKVEVREIPIKRNRKLGYVGGIAF